MPDTATFGRRAPAAASRPVSTPSRAAPPPDLDARAEAFRATIAADRGAASGGFDQWRRAQSGRTWLVRAVTVASFAPGLVSFVMEAPLTLSIGLEVAAVAANIWLRRERYRRLREIVAWEDPADAV